VTVSWVVRAARQLVPSAWRETVASDLDDERQRAGHGPMWLATRLLLVGVRLRLSFGGDAFVADLRGVVRSLLRAKGFTVAAVMTFGLGIGANIAVFSVIDRLMFRPLPYADPGRLVQIHHIVARGRESSLMLEAEVTEALRARATSLTGIAGAGGWVQATVPAPGENPLTLTAMTANAFDVLGIRPVIGRSYVETDAATSTDSAVLLTHETWQRRFGGSDAVLNMKWGNRVTYHVIGVLPADFVLPSSRFVGHVDGVSVLVDGPGSLTGRIITAPFARLRPGVSLAQAQAEVDTIMSDLSWASPHLQTMSARTNQRVVVQPLQSGLSMLVRPYLWLISSAVWIVLGVACANLATLLLARGRSRQHEAAVRAAIGASAGRLIRVAALEAFVLCAAASLVAICACALVERSLIIVVPPTLRGFAVPPLDPRVVGITLAVAFISACFAGALPAINVTRTDVTRVIQCSGGGRVSPLHGGGALLAIQAAFGVALVVGAAITVPAFVELLIKSPGFDPRDLYTVQVGHGAAMTPSEDSTPGESTKRAERASLILEAMRAVPHVQRADVVLQVPFGGFSSAGAMWKAHGLEGNQWAVGADFFETIETPFRAGRSFTGTEVQERALVAIVNETGSRALWPGQSPASIVGQRVKTNDGERVVVGVSADIRSRPGEPVIPDLFVPITAREMHSVQSAWPVVIRMDAEAVPDRALIVAALNDRFGAVGTVQVASVAGQLAPWLDRPRFLAALFGSLALIAIVLAGLGLYAVAGFESTRRRFEIGVRIALGAPGRDILGRILRVTCGPVLVGALVGLVAIASVTRFMRSLIPEVSTAEPWAYAVALLLMMAAALLATWLPARRASRVDPALILRTP
jgi:putative ABC transport system permease protein